MSCVGLFRPEARLTLGGPGFAYVPGVALAGCQAQSLTVQVEVQVGAVEARGVCVWCVQCAVCVLHYGEVLMTGIKLYDRTPEYHIPTSSLTSSHGIPKTR